MDDLVTIAICNFNTTELTNNCIRSIIKNVKKIRYKIVVLDNSDKIPFIADQQFAQIVNVIDNTNGTYANFDQLCLHIKCRPSLNNYASARHCFAIQFLLNICTTKHMVLLDSDTIVLRDFDFINDKYVFSSDIEQRPLDFRHIPYAARSLPYVIDFNVDLIKKHNLHYFDAKRLVETSINRIYDTGSSFLEDVSKNKLPFQKIDYKKYVNHLGGRSWSSTADIHYVISFTTFGNRLRHIERTLQQILKQKTMIKLKICITLDKHDISQLTTNQRNAISKAHAEIIVGDNKLRPHNKYFFVMQKYRNVPIITIDDDIQYDEHLVQKLHESHMNYPTCVSAMRTHLMTFDNAGHVCPYKSWKFEYVDNHGPNHKLFAAGVGGVLYPPNILKISPNDMPLIQKSIIADDVFLKKKELMLNVKVVNASKSGKLHAFPESFDSTALSKSGQNMYLNDPIISQLNFNAHFCDTMLS